MSSDDPPRENFPGGDVVPSAKELRVSIDKKAYSEIMCHVQEEDTDIEICGVLVGTLKQDRHGPFLHILHSIRGEKADRKGAQVTFTHDTWSHINREKDTKYADLDVVGWYHTHPGFDIFLSEMDRFIHNNFFGAPHQIAYVYDPHQGTEGMFRNVDGEIVMLERYWHGGKPRKTVPPEKRVKISTVEGGSGAAISADLPATLAALNDSIKRLQLEVRESQAGGSTLWSGMFLAIALLAGFFLGRLLSGPQMSLVEEVDTVRGTRTLRPQERIYLQERTDASGQKYYEQIFLNGVKLRELEMRKKAEEEAKKQKPDSAPPKEEK